MVTQDKRSTFSLANFATMWPILFGVVGLVIGLSASKPGSIETASVACAESLPVKAKLRTRAIEDCRVGQKVAGYNPLIGPKQFPDPDPATHRLLKLRMVKSDANILDIELLENLDWIAENHAGKTKGTGTFLMAIFFPEG